MFSYVWERSGTTLLHTGLAWQRPWENKLDAFICTRIIYSHLTVVALIRRKSACLVCKPANFIDAFYRHFLKNNVCFPDNCFNVIKEIYAL